MVFINNVDTTLDEQMELIKALLGINGTTKESTTAMFTIAVGDKNLIITNGLWSNIC